MGEIDNHFMGHPIPYDEPEKPAEPELPENNKDREDGPKQWLEVPHSQSASEKVERELPIQEEISAAKFEQLVEDAQTPEDFLNTFYWVETDPESGKKAIFPYPKYLVEKIEYEISESAISNYVDKYLSLLENLCDCPDDTSELTTDEKWKFSQTITRLISRVKAIDIQSREAYKETNSFSDKIYTSTVSKLISGKHTLSADKLLTHLLSNPQMIKPKCLYQGVSDIVAAGRDPEQSEEIQEKCQEYIGRMVHDLVYDLSFHGNRFRQALAEIYQESDVSDFSRVVRMLEVAKRIYNVSAGQGWSDRAAELLHSEIQNIASEAPNYILSKCAENTLGYIDDSNQYINTHKQNFNRWKSEDAYMRQLDGNMQLQLHGKLTKPIAPALLGIFDADGNLLKYLPQEETDSAVPSSISTLPLFMDRVDDSETDIEAKKDDVETYRLLASLPIREAVEADFGINFADISPRIQYYFLNFLKNRSRQEAEGLSLFVKKFGKNAFSGFLSLEYGEGYGHKLVETCNQLPEEEARALLHEMNEIYMSANELQSAIGLALQKNVSVDNPNGISNQIFEAVMRKNKDFITAAENVVNGGIESSQLLNSMQELGFVIGELATAFETDAGLYSISEKKEEVRNGKRNHTTWMLSHTELPYALNLTIRPEPAPTTVTNKESGQREEIMAQASIRASFRFPDGHVFGLRLDLDPHYKNEQFPNGRITFDIGSRGSQIADILAKVSEGGHHNPESFEAAYSSPFVFAQICTALNDKMESLQTATSVQGSSAA